MKWFLLMVTIVNVGFAKNSFLDSLINQKGSCPESYDHLPDQPAQDLLNRGYELRARQKDCDSIQYFQEVRRQWPIKPYFKIAWKEIIKSYLLADDYTAAINEGNVFLDEMRGTPDVEEIHLILINAVNIQMMKAGSERSQEWTEYALGISKKQNDENPYLKNLSFKSYLERYPDSPNLSTVKGMMAHARNNHAEYHLKIGNYYAIRIAPDLGIPNYPAAVMRYDIVLKWGPTVTTFSQALYSTVDVLYKMKSAILAPGMLKDDDLKMWLQIDSIKDKSVLDRQALVRQIDLQIAELQKKLNSETITQDIWVLKTKSLMEEKQK